jgi:hypothetical protein
MVLILSSAPPLPPSRAASARMMAAAVHFAQMRNGAVAFYDALGFVHNLPVIMLGDQNVLHSPGNVPDFILGERPNGSQTEHTGFNSRRP